MIVICDRNGLGGLKLKRHYRNFPRGGILGYHSLITMSIRKTKPKFFGTWFNFPVTACVELDSK